MAQDSEQLLRNPELIVHGEHVSEVDPELVYVLTELSTRARRRDDVFQKLRERSEWQREILDRYADKIEKEEMTAHAVNPVVDREASDQPTGFVGEIQTKIIVKDLSCIGDLVSELSMGDMCAVTAVAWTLRPQSPVYRATRIAAVHDAMSRARDYCAAVGSQITGLLSVTEPDRGACRPEPAQAERFTSAGGHQSGVLFDFRPVKQTIRAEVEARFTILPPKFG
jgi:uncharacterized protein YggE